MKLSIYYIIFGLFIYGKGFFGAGGANLEDVDYALFVQGIFQPLGECFYFVLFQAKRKNGFLDADSPAEENLGEPATNLIVANVESYYVMHDFYFILRGLKSIPSLKQRIS